MTSLPSVAAGYGITDEQWSALSPDERVEAERELAELAAVRDRNPLAFVALHDKQRAFLASRSFRKAFFGGNGSGKSQAGTIDDCIQLVDREVLPPELLKFKWFDPPFRLRVVVPKFGGPFESAVQKFRDLLPTDQLLGDSFDKAFKVNERTLKLKNGSIVLFNTGDQDVDAHSALELDRVRFDEEPEGAHGRKIYDENLMRLRAAMPHAQVVFTMTPLFGLSWTFDELWERSGQETSNGVYDGADGCFCVVASLLDNPFVDGQALLNELSHLTAEEKAARIEGRFVHFHGLVMQKWDAGLNVVDPPTRSHVQGLETEVWIDPGVARGGVAWVGFDRDNSMLVYDELYPSGWTVGEIAQAIREKNAAWGVEPVTYGIDPSARNRALTNAESVESLFSFEGIHCIHGQNDRLAGVLQLRQRAQAGALAVSRQCASVLKERERWLVAEDEESGKGAASGFKTKGPDHLWDPIRYAAMNRLWVPDAPDRDRPKDRWRPGHAPAAVNLAGSSASSAPPLGAMS